MDFAAEQILGRRGLCAGVEFAGRTDLQIARDLYVAGGTVPSDGDVARLVGIFLDHLEEGAVRFPYCAIHDVRGAVVALRNAGALVGLGTGNARRGAVAKLRSAGLVDLFDIDLGGYGDDAYERADVLRVAVERCDPSRGKRVVVIGDTPHDVRAADAIGAICVGVTTGYCGESDLRGAGALEVVDLLDASIVGTIRELLSEP